ncbi:winged helix-turn-helix domain-containing protein [Haloplanus sp. C73]|uniref:winged helix-turn-helix domain-containing protein n=1 Tax=Haloplanus sp. C73 TaxID=3421641 RepID=UPI003EB7FBEB
MEKALWYLLAGMRGGPNRVRIIRLLDDRPRNANRLADALGVDYNTARHHLDILIQHDVVEAGGEDYGELYFLTERFENNRDIFERITDQTDVETGTDGGDSAVGPTDNEQETSN